MGCFFHILNRPPKAKEGNFCISVELPIFCHVEILPIFGKFLVKIHMRIHKKVGPIVGWFKNPLSSQTEKLMAATKFSDYLGLNHYKKAKKNKTFHSFKVGPTASKFKYIP